MQPKPMDILKKDRPMAISTTSPLMRAKSGMKRKRRPAPVLGRVRLRMQTATSSRKSRGMSTRVTRSMPPEAPRMITAAMKPNTNHCQSRLSHGLASSSPKMRAATSGSVVATPPLRALGT